MAQLGTFATTASNVVVDASERRVTISNEVVEIDGVLDPPTGFDDWGGWEIICQSSGGLRSTSGASGTLGGGKHSLKIVEKSNGHRFGADNYNKTAANQRARFYGDGTNVLRYENIVWIVETGDRSDFDWYQGAAGNGSNGPKCVLSGVSLYQLTQSGQTAHFNHYSSQSSIVIHDEVGYGLLIANYTNGHALQVTHDVQTGAQIAGLVIENIASPTNNSSGGRVVFVLNNIPSNGSITFSNLDTPSISAENGDASRTLILIDPVGVPTRVFGWNGYHGNVEIKRTVPFNFSPANPAGETMYARATSGSAHSTATMTGASGSIQVRTSYSANAASGGAWTTSNQYRFYMAGLGFRKYFKDTTTISNTPTAINVNLIKDELPNGTAISTIPVTNSSNLPANLEEILRHIKDHERDGANPYSSTYPTSALAYVDGNEVKIHDSYRVVMNSANTTPLWDIGQASGHDRIRFRTESTIDTGSNGLTTLSATGTGETITNTNVAEGDGVFFKDSTGQRSVVNITNNMGAGVTFHLVDTSDGSTTGSTSAAVSNGSNSDISITTKGLTTGYKLVGKRPGYNYYAADVDLTGGGLKEFTAPLPTQIVQPDGSASYVSTVSIPANELDTVFSVVDSTTPKSRINIGNDTFTARQVFKRWEDDLATASGASYMGLGGGQITYTLSALKGNEMVLGAHTKVQRKRSTDVNATIRATLYANDDAPVDNTSGNGDVMTIEGLDIPAVAEAIITTTDFDTTETGVQSVWGKLNAIATAIDEIETGGGGGGASAASIWEYREPISTFTPSQISGDDIRFTGSGANIATGTPLRLDNTGGYSGPIAGTVYFARNAGSGHIQLFPSLSEAQAGVQNNRITLTGNGNVGSVRVTTLRGRAIDYVDNIPADVWGHGTKIVTNTIPTAEQITTSVWDATERTLTSDAAPSVREIWDTALVDTRIVNMSPTGISSGVVIQLSDSNLAMFENKDGTKITIERRGGYTEVAAGDVLYTRHTSGGILFYADRNNAINQQGSPVVFTSPGTPTSLQFDAEIVDEYRSPNALMREVHDDVHGTIPSVSQIVEGVWAEIVDGGITTDLTITPEAEAGDGFRIPADDAALISNGDAFQFTATGNYSNITTTETYYAYVLNNVLYIYGSRHNAVTPGAPWIQPSGGTLADVRIVFVGKRPVGTAGVALHRILAAIVELDNDHAAHSQATEAIGVLMNQILGVNYIEQGMTLAQAVQILVAVAAGKMSTNGSSYTFHRMDSGETAVIRATAGEDGRTAPTRNPT